jgi:hypothetical protein
MHSYVQNICIFILTHLSIYLSIYLSICQDVGAWAVMGENWDNVVMLLGKAASSNASAAIGGVASGTFHVMSEVTKLPWKMFGGSTAGGGE